MITPQQIDQIAFSKAKFGGYNMEQVDEILEPLTEDYVTLYKENALLKSKMRVLVAKLEEYRKNEATMKEAARNAQQNCERLIREAEAKAAQLVKEAENGTAAPAAEAVPVEVTLSEGAQALVDAENARVEEARRAATAKIAEIQTQMQSCIQALERIKKNNAPASVAPVSDSVADEIAQNVEALVGSAVDAAPKAAPAHPQGDTTTSRFANLNLQFGRNYDPSSK